ncbi:uncharacterized protein MONOS_17658 [Monocercomonoides exilis]|uniref:uncharacterized protein n=1 Tax=Monocercomonoides exilis TaxID=2049356 RepID=UPI00355A01AA|nr:hypothetical protein MONOS_17658 [Monocercomonoides exilis]
MPEFGLFPFEISQFPKDLEVAYPELPRSQSGAKKICASKKFSSNRRCVSGEPEGYDDDYDRRKKAVFEAKVADQAEHACHAG